MTRKEVYMAKDSNTILLFTEHRDAISYLTDEEAGQMIKAIYDYACEGVVPKFAGQRERERQYVEWKKNAITYEEYRRREKEKGQ